MVGSEISINILLLPCSKPGIYKSFDVCEIYLFLFWLGKQAKCLRKKQTAGSVKLEDV
jgi:hypothetical protein